MYEIYELCPSYAIQVSCFASDYNRYTVTLSRNRFPLQRNGNGSVTKNVQKISSESPSKGLKLTFHQQRRLGMQINHNWF